MGLFCRICGTCRPNERFTGRGHRQHICRDCQRLPKAERQRIEELEEISCCLDQSNISAKNVARLNTLCDSADADVRELATLVLDIARAHPRKRRRWKFLASRRRDLLIRLKSAFGEEWLEDVLFDAQIPLPELNDDPVGPPGNTLADEVSNSDAIDDDEIPF